MSMRSAVAVSVVLDYRRGLKIQEAGQQYHNERWSEQRV